VSSGNIDAPVVLSDVQETLSSDQTKPEQEVNSTDPFPTPSVPSISYGGESCGTTPVVRKRAGKFGSESNRGGGEADVESNQRNPRQRNPRQRNPRQRNPRQRNPRQRNSRQRHYRLRNPRRRNYRLRNPRPHSEVEGVVGDGSRRVGNDISEEEVDLAASTSNNDPCSLDHMPETECVGCFRSPSGPSNDTQPTRPSPDTAKPGPRLRGKDSSPNQLVDLYHSLFHRDSHRAYLSFLHAYPEYKLTQPVDSLRKREYKRLKQSDEVYVDYMGASLYPESLIRSNSTFLRRAVLGNTHSSSTRYAPEVR
jgi:hypothetical protein